MAKFLVQLFHLEDSHKRMLARDRVDVGGEGGGEVGEVDEARALGEARAEGEVTNPEVHHQASLLQEASQAVLHHEGEEAQEGEATQTVATSSKTFIVSPQPRWWPTSSNILVTCAWSSTARTAKPCCGRNCPVPP